MFVPANKGRHGEPGEEHPAVYRRMIAALNDTASNSFATGTDSGSGGTGELSSCIGAVVISGSPEKVLSASASSPKSSDRRPSAIFPGSSEAPVSYEASYLLIGRRDRNHRPAAKRQDLVGVAGRSLVSGISLETRAEGAAISRNACRSVFDSPVCGSALRGAGGIKASGSDSSGSSASGDP